MKFNNYIKLILLLLMPVTPVMAQMDVSGSETRTNVTTANSQQQVDVASNGSGNFVVVWESHDQDGDDYGIYASLYDSSGSVILSEFQVNTTTSNSQRFPAVELDESDNMHFVWMSLDQDDAIKSWGIYQRVISSAGTGVVSETLVNDTTSGEQTFPDISLSPDGSYVITWASDGNIKAKRYSSAGVSSGTEFLVNTTTDSLQTNPKVATIDDGSFIITWQSIGNDGSGQGVYAQRYDNTGTANGSEFRVNSTTSDNQQSPSIACDSSGNFIIVWESYGQDSEGFGIYAQKYNSDGSTNGSEFRVNDYQTSDQTDPDIAMSEGGNYLISWTSFYHSGGDTVGVYYELYDESGSVEQSETQVNTYTSGYQQIPAVAFSADEGLAVIAWQDGYYSSTSSHDGDDYGVYFQRYQVGDLINPVAVCKDTSVELNAVGDASITVDMVENGSTDNDGIASYSLSKYNFDCGDVLTKNTTLTVTDSAGNQSSCVATITVYDVNYPSFSTKSATVYLDASGSATISVSDVYQSGTATDDCGVIVDSVDVTSFSCSDIGDNTVNVVARDPSNNYTSNTATVTVIDSISPTVATQDLIVYLDGSGSATILASDLDNGSSDICGINSYSADITSFTCADIGTNTVTLTVTDAGGNSASGTSTVTVLDTIHPSVVTQDLTVYLDGSGSATILGADVDNGSTDNCSIASYSLDVSSFSCADVGSNTVTLTVTDGSGNSVSGTATVTVVDSVTTTAVAQDITVFLDGTGSATITASDIDNGSADNCGSPTLSVDQTDFDCSHVGANTVTLTATDGSGNTSTATATVTVSDTSSPSVMTQDITVYVDGTGSVTILASDVDNGSTDNCGIASSTIDLSTFTCSEIGSNTVTLTVTDVNGNISSGTATVTVADTTSPTVVTQDITVNLDGSGNATITTGDIDNGSSDNCSIASLSLDVSSFTCTETGANTVTLTAVDASGNTSSATATVTVLESEAPTAVAQDITVFLDGTGSATITASDIDNGSADNCGSPTLSTDQTDFDCSHVGANTVTLTATDGSGNTSSATATVTVSDTSSPSVTTQDITVYVDGTGSVTIAASDIDNGSTDNCGIASSAIDVSTFTCSEIGSNTVTLTVTDVNGNISSGTATVTVADTTSPTVVTQDITVNLDGSGNATITTGDIDNGSNDNCSIASLSLDVSSFTCTETGTNTVTLTAVDASGNTSSATATVTVLESEAPTAVAQDITVFLDGTGSATITASDIDNGSADNCGSPTLSIDQTDFDCSHEGANTVTLTATDGSGNTSTATATVTVSDTSSPSVMTQDITVYVDGTGSVTIVASDVDNGSTDNCGIASSTIDVSTFTCSEIGSNTVTLTVTDVNGNISSGTATVTVADTTSPTVVTQDITVNLDGSGNATITTGDIDNGSNDNCSIASLSLDVSSFTCTETGTNTVTLTAVDASGNTSSATATVTVLESEAPTAVAQDITVFLDGTGSATITASDIDNGSADNCGSPTLSIDQTDFDCSHVGANTVTLTATDGSGNTSTATATVTVSDTSSPSVMTQDITIYVDGTGSVTIAASDVDNGSTDNCGIASSTIDVSTFTCSGIGSNTVTLTVTDVNGNINSGTATVTVADTLKPTVVTQNFTANLDGSGNVSITVSDIDNGSNDNCGIATTSLSQTDFSCADAGTNTIYLIVTDVNGNVDSATANVDVLEFVGPVAMTQDISVYLDVDGLVTVSAIDVDNGSTDNCGITNYALDDSTFDCSNLGTNNVVLTVSDGSGNSASANAVITVLDTIAPVAGTPDTTVYLDANGQVTVTATDLGGSDNCSIASSSLDITDFDCSDIGANVVSMTVTDQSGNTSSGSLSINIADSTGPVVVTQNLALTLDVSGTSTISTTDINNGSSDNCGIDSMYLDKTEFTCQDAGITIVTLTVVDLYGNTSSATAEVDLTITDGTPPVAMAQSYTAYLDNTGQVTVPADSIDNGSFDECSIAEYSLSQSTFNCTEVGDNNITFTVTDFGGNTDDTTITITVMDTISPTAIALDTSISVADGDVVLSAGNLDNGSTDNCDFTATISQTLFTSSDLGDNAIILTIEDASGNISTDTSIVNVTLSTSIAGDLSGTTIIKIYADQEKLKVFSSKYLESANVMVYTLNGKLLYLFDDVDLRPEGTYLSTKLDVVQSYILRIEYNDQNYLKAFIPR